MSASSSSKKATKRSRSKKPTIRGFNQYLKTVVGINFQSEIAEAKANAFFLKKLNQYPMNLVYEWIYGEFGKNYFEQAKRAAEFSIVPPASASASSSSVQKPVENPSMTSSVAMPAASTVSVSASSSQNDIKVPRSRKPIVIMEDQSASSAPSTPSSSQPESQEIRLPFRRRKPLPMIIEDQPTSAFESSAQAQPSAPSSQNEIKAPRRRMPIFIMEDQSALSATPVKESLDEMDVASQNLE